MNENKHMTTEEADVYTTPTISDYGDLVELTAAGATGRRADANFVSGQIVTFLSSSP